MTDPIAAEIKRQQKIPLAVGMNDFVTWLRTNLDEDERVPPEEKGRTE